MIKKADILLFVCLLLFGIAVSWLSLSGSITGENVRVTVDGKLYGVYPLSENREVEIDHAGHTNHITIKDGTVAMTSSSCKNQVCVQTIPVPIPGVKLGLANLVILIALYRLGFRYAFTINCVRIVIAGLLFSGVFGMLYSFGGGILSILVMYLLYRTKLFSMVGISMAGGVMHNLGQLLTACAIMSNISLLSYFAVLFFSGLISGILIGILAYSIEQRLPADFR